MEEFMKNYERWLASNKLGESERAELEALRGNEDEIKERFSSLLSFGTAGLRGTMAMGMHNMNIYTVTQATQGFAAYIRACGEDAVKRGVVVGCDSRHNSLLPRHCGGHGEQRDQGISLRFYSAYPGAVLCGAQTRRDSGCEYHRLAQS